MVNQSTHSLTSKPNKRSQALHDVNVASVGLQISIECMPRVHDDPHKQYLIKAAAKGKQLQWSTLSGGDKKQMLYMLL